VGVGRKIPMCVSAMENVAIPNRRVGSTRSDDAELELVAFAIQKGLSERNVKPY
jgi:hypothetical protein